MIKETNIERAREVALALLNEPIRESDIPTIVYHPIFTCSVYYANGGMLNLLDKAEFAEAKRSVENQINNSDLLGIYMVIREPYRLTFLFYSKDYLSMKDYSELLADAYVMAENPSIDQNVSIDSLVQMFREADPRFMMEEDYEEYKNLPETLHLFRGVASKSNPRGLGWTDNIEKAKWFADRFKTNGYVLEADIPRSRVLAVFRSRGEDEIVCDVKGIKLKKINA